MRKIIYFIGVTYFLAACQLFTPDPTPEQLAQQKKIAQINLLLEKIEQDIDSRRLTLPKNNNALDKLNEIVELDPNHPAIDEIKIDIAQSYVDLFSSSFERKKLDAAQNYLAKAKAISPELESIAVSQTIIDNYIAEQKALARIKDEERKKKQADILKQEKAAAEKIYLESIAAAKAREKEQEKEKERIEHLTITRLNQTDINARSKLVGIALDKITPEVIESNKSIIIQTQNQRDYKWLSALLRTSIYFVDSDFALDVKEDINLGEPPRIRYAE